MRDAPLFPLPFPVPAGAALVSAKTGPMPPGGRWFLRGDYRTELPFSIAVEEF
jgi:hypothetical protein